MGIIDLAPIRFMPARYAGDLDMADIDDVAPQFHLKIAFDSLAVIAVELHLQVERANCLADRLRLFLAIQKISRHVACVDGFNQYRDAVSGRMMRGIGQIAKISLIAQRSVFIGADNAGHHMQAGNAQDIRITEGAFQAALEFFFTPGNRCNAALASRPVSRRTIEQNQRQSGIFKPRPDLAGHYTVREMKFHALETVARSSGETVEEIVFLVHQAEIGSELRHGNVTKDNAHIIQFRRVASNDPRWQDRISKIRRIPLHWSPGNPVLFHFMHRHHDHHSSGHLHAHHEGDARHSHTSENRSSNALWWSLILTLGFAGVEVIAGFWSNSLALISDAGHMVTDATALGVAILAQLIARRPPSPKNSFGFGRAEALAAFVNALAMLAVVGWIGFEAIQRFSSPEAIRGEAVMTVAAIGLAVNMLVAWILSHDKDNLNTRAALVHVLGDMMGSFAAIVAGAVVYYTGWLQIDPLLSLLVSLLILKSTISVLLDSYHFLMEGVPHHIDYMQVGEDLAAVEGVLSVHDLHVWEMSPGQPALIGHVEVQDFRGWPGVLAGIKQMLLQKYGIDHVTLQPEIAGASGETCHQHH